MIQNLRNIVGGSMMGFGSVFLAGFVVMMIAWSAQAPATPDPARGLIYPFHTNDGDIVYQFAFQERYAAYVALAAVGLNALGWLITPKTRRNAANRFDSADRSAMKLVPRQIAPAAFVLGGLAGGGAALAVFLLFNPY